MWEKAENVPGGRGGECAQTRVKHICDRCCHYASCWWRPLLSLSVTAIWWGDGAIIRLWTLRWPQWTEQKMTSWLGREVRRLTHFWCCSREAFIGAGRQNISDREAQSPSSWPPSPPCLQGRPGPGWTVCPSPWPGDPAAPHHGVCHALTRAPVTCHVSRVTTWTPGHHPGPPGPSLSWVTARTAVSLTPQYWKM